MSHIIVSLTATVPPSCSDTQEWALGLEYSLPGIQPVWSLSPGVEKYFSFRLNVLSFVLLKWESQWPSDTAPAFNISDSTGEVLGPSAAAQEGCVQGICRASAALRTGGWGAGGGPTGHRPACTIGADLALSALWGKALLWYQDAARRSVWTSIPGGSHGDELCSPPCSRSLPQHC